MKAKYGTSKQSKSILRGYKAHAIILSLVVALNFSSCSVNPPEGHLNETYGELVKQDVPDRNPVIVIPGVLGSKLYDPATQTVVWGSYTSGTLSPTSGEGARQFALPMTFGKNLANIEDGVIPNGALDSFHLTVIPGLNISPKAYAQILGVLGAGGYIDETIKKAQASQSNSLYYGDFHFSCFQFDYDWRQSNAKNALRLHQFIKAKKEQVRLSRIEKYGKSGLVKFDIVAYSMGGLLARYYLRYGDQQLPKKGLPKLNWKGAADIEKVVLIGSPHLGSSESLVKLCEGFQVAPIFTPKYDATLVGTMPSLYELLPRTRHGLVSDNGQQLDIFELATWEKYQWGLANSNNDSQLKLLLPAVGSPPGERRKIVLDHLSKCLDNARRFHEAIDKPASPPRHLKLVAWVGDSGKTLTFLSAKKEGVDEGLESPGDETVPRYSAIADERGPSPKRGQFITPIHWSDVNYIYKNHLEMTKDINFSDNLLAFLLEQGGSAGSSDR